MTTGNDELHRFDRRQTDANVHALSLRVQGLEGRMERVEGEVHANRRELEANTALTKQVHRMAERTEKNTKDIVDAVKWIGTSKRVAAAVVLGLGGTAGAASAFYQFGKIPGWW